MNIYQLTHPRAEVKPCASPRKRRVWLVLALTLMTGIANAQSTDLLTALKAAQETDPTIRAARYALDIALLKSPEARAALLPTITFSGNANSSKDKTSFAGGPAINRGGSSQVVTLQLVQPIFRVDSFLANNQVPLLIENAKAVFDQAHQDLLLRVAAAYFALIESKDVLADADAQVTAMNRQLLEISKGYEAGTRSITDVDDTKARLGAARAQQIAARGEIVNAQADLERLTGTRYTQVASLPDGIALPSPQPATSDDWIDQARDNNPQVRAMRAAVAVASLDVSRARSGHLPTVDLVASVGRNHSSHSLTTPDDYSTLAAQKEIGVQVNVPLFAGGAIVTKVSQAEAALEKSRADLDAARRDAANEAQHAFNSVLNNLAQAEALTVAVSSSQSALKGNQAGFQVGYRTNVDVLTAQQQLFSARSSLSKARYEALLQGLKLKAAAGILIDADLESIAARMQ